MHSEKALRQSIELSRLIDRLRRQLRGRVRYALDEHGQSAPEWLVIANLKWQGQMTQAALADQIGVNAPNVSRLIDRPEKKGLAARVRCCR